MLDLPDPPLSSFPSPPFPLLLSLSSFPSPPSPPPSPTHKVFGFYEELLSTRFPHSSFKLVFVDHAYQDVSSYSTLGIVRLVHCVSLLVPCPLYTAFSFDAQEAKVDYPWLPWLHNSALHYIICSLVQHY